jgi:hypothetical protein
LKFDTAGQPVGGYTLANTGQVLSISATRDGSGNPFLFGAGTDNQVYTLQFDASGNPVGKFVLATAGTVQSITATRGPAGNPFLLV